MRITSVQCYVSLFLWSVIAAFLVDPGSANAQAKRIAILPFDDSLARTQQLQIGQRVADGLISKIAGNGTFEVIDRENLSKLIGEQANKYDEHFALDAAKSGRLKNVDMLVVGRVDAFIAQASSAKSNGFLSNKTTVTGQIELKVTARLISVETASIIAAPTSSSELSQVLAETTDFLPSNRGSISRSTGAQDVQGALLKLVDSSVGRVSADLAMKIENSAGKIPVAGPVSAIAKVVGMDGGLTLINRGSNVGIKVGQQFVVVRLVDTGLKDPDTGQPVTKKKKICALAISELDDSTSSGKCDGDQPQAGDEVRAAQN